MKSLVTVIVPMYNAAQYICEALESIVASTYRPIEVIVMDDGSTDESGSICDEYANKDSRVKVLHIKSIIPIVTITHYTY